MQRRFLRKRGTAGESSAWRKRAEPSPSLLRKSTSPEGGRFCSTYRKMPKSSPFGGAGIEQSEMTERVSLRTLPKKAGNISLTLREWGLFCIESRLHGVGGIC